MEPVLHPTIAAQERLTLRNLILVVRKSQVSPARVQKGRRRRLAKHLSAKRGALNVPTRPSAPKCGVPSRDSGIGDRFPQRKIAEILLLGMASSLAIDCRDVIMLVRRIGTAEAARGARRPTGWPCRSRCLRATARRGTAAAATPTRAASAACWSRRQQAQARSEEHPGVDTDEDGLLIRCEVWNSNTAIDTLVGTALVRMPFVVVRSRWRRCASS